MNQVKVVLLASMFIFLTSCENLKGTRRQDGAGKVESVDSAKVKALFKDPPREYSSGPLWVWNDMLTEEQITSTLRELAEQKVKQVFVHPRPGLMTPYLSDDWFRLWKVALKEAGRLDMNVWIYDENSYPSGFAGGLVPDAMPESRGRGLHLNEQKQPPQLSDDIIGVYKLNGGSFENVTERIRSGEVLPESRYLVASIRRAGNSPWHGGKCYVDLLYPGVTEKFLEITMEAYRRRIGDEFGKRVPGVFTDEPQLRPAGGFPWTDDLPQVFKKRWGYDLMDNLPSLSRPVGEWKRVRHNYFQVLLDLFIERWGRPYYEYCKKYGIEFTGHYWEHEWPNCIIVPDNMAMSAWQQRPGIDTLMNQYREDTHAQFGNIRAVKELCSVANQLGRKRTLCEAYGAGGWDLRFEDMKRIGDWLYVLGINTLNEHLSYITIRGARKRDHPQSFSYHEPWWPAYHVMASYFTRLSMMLSQGEQVNTVLLIEPTTTAWMYQADSTHRGNLGKIGNEFQNMVAALSKAQVEYDIGCEDIIKRHGGVIHADLADKQGRLVDGWTKLTIGYRAYDTVVIPPHTENLNASTVRLLKQCIGQGTRVLCCGDPPTLIDGLPSDRAKKLAENTSWQRVDPDDLPAKLLELSDGKFAIRRSQNDKGILFHHRRRIDDGEILFLVNTSIDSPSSGEIESSMKGVEQWKPETGAIKPYPFRKNEDSIKADFELEPCGSLLLFLSKKTGKSAPEQSQKTTVIPALAKATINRIAPNVLTLDYVDITAGGETKKNIYFYQANQFAFRKNGMERNPWDSAVQFRDELITRKFPADSGFEAMYRFNIEGSVPSKLFIVIERPDLYSITCNGKAVSAKKGSWWFDKAFGKIDIASAAGVGENTVTIKARPMTIYHELEPAYVLGNFALKAADSGFVIVPERGISMDSRRTHSSVPDGSMWLSTGIGFSSAGVEQQSDQAPWIIFDLGGPGNLEAIRIWNYNESSHTHRGVKQLRITASTSARPDSFDVPLGTFDLDQAPGSPTVSDFSQRLSVTVKAKGVRFVKFDILSNHNGVNFPTTDGGSDNAFVGLSEVRFYTGTENNLKQMSQVRVTEVSSQLTHNFNRRAQFLVDGSGLTGIGWNQQGYPFYAAGVSYKQSFNITRPAGRYYVHLPDWYGSVAKVIVNGETAGYIYCQPWECEVTGLIRKGSNTIEVVVIGTLKNTLGPHHGNQPLGSAWPGMFHSGPEPGPPPGDQYSTVGYGLFEPFELYQR